MIDLEYSLFIEDFPDYLEIYCCEYLYKFQKEELVFQLDFRDCPKKIKQCAVSKAWKYGVNATYKSENFAEYQIDWLSPIFRDDPLAVSCFALLI